MEKFKVAVKEKKEVYVGRTEFGRQVVKQVDVDVIKDLNQNMIDTKKTELKDAKELAIIKEDANKKEKESLDYRKWILEQEQRVSLEKLLGITDGLKASGMMNKKLKKEEMAMAKKLVELSGGDYEIKGGVLTLTETASLIGNSPVPFMLEEPGEIEAPEFEVSKIPKINPPELNVEGVVGDKGAGKMINDNRAITINVNQRDQKMIEQIVLNALYTDKMIKER